MTSRVLPCVAAVLLGCFVLAADPSRPDGHPPAIAGGDVQDVVLLGDKGPLLLRLHLTVDGKPFQAAYRDALDVYLTALFNHLDRNGDGVLNEEEAGRMPPPFKTPGDPTAGGVNVAFNYRVVDADGDGKVTRAELAEYHRQFSGGPVQLQPTVRTAVPPAVNEALFNLLDANKDGKLSKEELAAAATILSKLDLDHDEMLTPEEIAPAVYAAGIPQVKARQAGMGNPALGQQTLFVLATDDDRAGLAAALLARYGNGKKKLRGPDLGLSEEAVKQFDADKDGALDAAELEHFADRPADVELVVRLGKRTAGQEPLAVFHADGKGADPRPSGDSGLILPLGGAWVELRVNTGRPEQEAGRRNRILDLFHAADAGNKGYLTRDKAQENEFFPSQFALLDRDGDGKLTERELTTYLDEVQERQARLIAATPSLLLSDRGQGLFELLDRDRDGRLSVRELRAAPRLLARLGREAVGTISREDLTPTYQLAIGLGQASLSRAGPGTYTPREAPMLTLDWGRADLQWFYKMDRNRDGDVSPREFLGTAEDFRRIDTDGDGLISLEEAEKAAGMFKKK